VGGVRILDRLVDACALAFGQLPLLVANAPEASAWRPDLTVVPDRRPGLGALGGLYTAVTEGPAPVVVIAWDMPFITAPLLRALADGLASHDCMLPASDGPRGLEPMCAAYGPACTVPMADALDAGDLRAVAFHPRVNVGILTPSAAGVFGDPAVLFSNVNTPDDLTTAQATWQRLISSPSSGGRTPARPR
jgi:molybdopterin-guanine dinucleotide biosynthesis protein A